MGCADGAGEAVDEASGDAAGGATGGGTAPSAGAEPVLLFPAQAAPCSGDCGPLA